MTGFVRVRGAREHNLKSVSLDIPRDALVVFTGVSGSGKSSLAFGTLYAEAQRRYLESVAPYARRLFDQMGVPDVDEIDGLPPAVALQQQRGSPTSRSSVGSVTTLSNLLRMLYSRAGDYPPGQTLLAAEAFSTNTPEGACPTCHGLGRVYDATERSMVPDDSLSIRERAIAAWPTAWHGQNLRDIVTTLGYDVNTPWRNLPKKDRDWLLFTDEQPQVPVYAGYTREEVRRAIKRREPMDYQGTFTGARRYVLHTFATTQSASIRKRVSQHLVSGDCPLCGGKRLRREALSVTFGGRDIAEVSGLPIAHLAALLAPYRDASTPTLRRMAAHHADRAVVVERIVSDLAARIAVLIDLGLGYLSLDRSTPTLSPGELQRLRLATQVRSNLFGVVYVLDEPSAGLHPADTEALLRALDRLKASGNSLFVVEHDLDVIRHADWLVDVGPAAGDHGGTILYSGPPAGLEAVQASQTRRHLFAKQGGARRTPRTPRGWLRLSGITRNNLHGLDVAFPLGVFTTVTGVSGSGKSTLVSQALVELVAEHLGHEIVPLDEDAPELERMTGTGTGEGRIVEGLASIRRLVQVDQRPIGRTPRSNLATYTGLFDHVRRLFAATKAARARRYDAGRFSFNVKKGRCETCEGEGFVCVELLFLASVYAPCSTCHGARYNAKTLEIEYRGRNIADVLKMTVDTAAVFFEEEAPVRRSLEVLREVGLGYLRLGQPATELSGGEAQRIKLATELQRAQRGNSLYVLDEPTTGLHPSDVDRLITQLEGLVQAGNTVIVVEHDMRVVTCGDWVIDMGPGAGDEGGRVVASGTPVEASKAPKSATAKYLARFLGTVASAALGLMLVAPSALLAQDPVQEHVIVTGHAGEVAYETLARTVVVLTREEIRRLPVHSVAELLAYVSSIDVRSRGPFGIQSDFALRGATFGQALVLVDGFRLNDVQSGHHNADIPVPVSEIDRIEILFGPGSSLYGADAFGGTVNVITRRTGETRSASGSAGQFGFGEVAAAVGGAHRGVDASLAIAANRSSGFEIDRDFRTLAVSSRTTFASGLRLWASHLYKDFGANGFYGPALSTESTNQTLLVFDGRMRGPRRWTGQWQTGYRTHGDEFLYDSTKPGVPNTHRSHSVQGSARLRRDAGKTTRVTVGGDVGADRIASSNLGRHALTRASGFAEIQQRLGQRIVVYPSLRVDAYSTFGRAFSPALAATGWAGRGVKLTGSIGRAFRVPTFTERFYSDPNNSGTPTLVPERAWSGEAGIDWLPAPAWTTGLAVFHRRDRDTIDFVRPSSRVRWQAANVGRVQTTGFEATVQRRLASGAVSARYTYLDADAEALPMLSKYVLEFARQSIAVSGSATVAGGFEIGQRIDYKRRRDGREYWVADTRVGRRVGAAVLFVEGSNLLDRRYQEIPGVNMPGRWIRAGLSFERRP